MLRYTLLILSCLYSSLHLSATVPDLATVSIDSALTWLEQNVADTSENYLVLSLEVKKRAYASGDFYQMGRSHDQLASWYGYHGGFPKDSLIHHSESAVYCFSQTEDKIRLADTYLTLAVDYVNISDTERALETSFKALTIYEAEGDQPGIGKAYRRIALISNQEKAFERALEYGKKALEQAEADMDHYNAALCLLELLQACQGMEQYAEAYSYATRCIELVNREIPDQKGILTRAFSFRGDISINMDNLEQALSDHRRSWEIAVEGYGESPGTDTYRFGIGEVLLLQEKHREALPHLEAALAPFEGNIFNAYPKIWEKYEDLATCYEAVGNYPQALKFQKRAKITYDSLMTNKVNNLEKEALIKYETGKKDQELAAQAVLLEQKNRIQWLTIGISTLFATLFFAVLFLFRRNQKTNTALQAKNAENELLLKEIHHRVKNNLEMVSSLLRLQAVKTKDDEARSVMEASQNRVQSMGIIHQRLYQGENLASIEMLDYFKNLSENIIDAFNASGKVKVIYDMSPMEIDVDTAVPIGLIVNELLTNSLKYAFPGPQLGEIRLSLREVDPQHIRLEVADNGIGKKEDLPVQGTGFGSQLVKLLTQQLQGIMTADYSNGTRFCFDLEKPSYN